MKIITINVPEAYIEFFDLLKEKEICPSRSEAIRQVINLGWKEWTKQFKELKEITEILNLRETAAKDPDEIRVPTCGEYFSDMSNISTYKVVRRLE